MAQHKLKHKILGSQAISGFMLDAETRSLSPHTIADFARSPRFGNNLARRIVVYYATKEQMRMKRRPRALVVPLAVAVRPVSKPTPAPVTLPLRLLALTILALLAAACSLPSGKYSLLVSELGDRSFATRLQGQTVAADIYVSLDPADGVKNVLFFIDDQAASGVPTGIDKSAPFDLASGPDDAANPYDTRQLSNGRHTLTALVTRNAGGTFKVTASFEVKNKMDAGQYSLLVSKLSDRAFPTGLQGQTVTENLYPFLAPAVGVKQVLFFIDDEAASGVPTGIDKSAPFDLASGRDDAANPYDTRLLSDGRHTLTALVTHNAGGTFKVTAFFEVKNKTPSNSEIYWGVAIPGVPWDMTRLAAWESTVGKSPSIVHFWVPWTEQGEMYPFQPALLEPVREHGAIPMISWLPARSSQGADQPDYRLAAIAGGKYDSFIRAWARAAQVWGHPFFLRWAHEMNGFWYAWGEDANANQRGEFVKAWRHVVDVFRQQGATNVSWVWCPNIDWSGSGWPTMQELYPGDSYVDWTCLDGYNWGTDRGGWKNFNDVFRWSYENIRSIAPTKPVMLGEFGSSEKGGSKAAWITDTFGTQVPFDFPDLKAVVWYNVSAEEDWRIESSPESLAAFKAAIASPYYRTNTYRDLNAPIPP